MKKLLAVIIILLFVGMSFNSISGIQIDNKPVNISNRGDTLYVGGNGSGNYSKIQDAINDASDGDTVFVYDDSSPYYELLLIEKSIFLIGENKETTIIDGNYNGTVIIIRANDVTISHFTICNCLGDPYYVIDAENCKNLVIRDNIIIKTKREHNYGSGIILKNCSENLIQDNEIKGYWYIYNYDCIGITINDDCVDINISGNDIYEFTTCIKLTGNNCYNNIIYKNYIHSSWIGMEVESDRNKIINNTISNNIHSGIILTSNNNLISGNVIKHIEGSHLGAFSFGIIGKNNLIQKNYIAENSVGLSFDSDNGNNSILHNYISKNIFGILCSSTGDYLAYNEISNNEYGISCTDSSCIFMRNNIVQNGENADFFNFFQYFYRKNKWKNNYWSDYVGNRISPKIIYGEIYLFFFTIPWYQFDWHPASEPYDI